MDNWRRANVFLGFVAFAFALPATQGLPGDSLGELARRERERQQRVAKPAKVYNSDDLPAGRKAPIAEANPEAAGARDSRALTANDEEPDRESLEAEWRKRFAAARERIKDAERRAWKIVIRPVLVGGSASGLIAGKAVIVPMQVREFAETEELRTARKALDDLEDELRRAGLPAGWGRER